MQGGDLFRDLLFSVSTLLCFSLSAVARFFQSTQAIIRFLNPLQLLGFRPAQGFDFRIKLVFLFLPALNFGLIVMACRFLFAQAKFGLRDASGFLVFGLAQSLELCVCRLFLLDVLLSFGLSCVTDFDLLG